MTTLILFFSSTDKQPITAQEAVKDYLIDQHQQIQLQETSIAKNLSLPLPLNKNISDDQSSTTETSSEEAQIEELPEHNLAEYFRFLQTELAQGNSPSERTESIREHLLSSLSNKKAGELIDLYEKFTNFEQDAATKAKEWEMPENADDTLTLIGAMQQYQQEYFGTEVATQLFGAEMKVMEYNARRAIIINDPYESGSEKEQLLERLGIDMWGEESYQELNAQKDPYDILDEKLLVFRNELAALDTDTRQEEIKRLRHQYLPPGW